MGIDTLSQHIIQADADFLAAVYSCALDSEVNKILEIGSGHGDGATKTLLSALSVKSSASKTMRCVELSSSKYSVLLGVLSGFSFAGAVNGNSVATTSYKDKIDISDFFWDYADTKFRLRELDYVYPKLQDELDYITARATQLTNNAIASAISDMGDPDLVLLCGSEFCSPSDYAVAVENEPKFMILYDTLDIRNYENYLTIDADANYGLFLSGVSGDYEWKIYKHV